MRINLAGEQIDLFPERAMFWERGSALFVADVHWGKAATFRAKTLAIPDSDAEDLGRLERVLIQTQATTLYILGDLLHAEAGRTPSTLTTFAEWRSEKPMLDIVLVRGNHDKHAGDPPEDWRIRCVDAPFSLPPFVLLHVPDSTISTGYALAGHLHPGIVLTGTGRQSLKVPCFWFGENSGVLPAFGRFTGTMPIQPSCGEHVFAVTDNAVIEKTVY